jgi:hypothetical protein
MSHLSRRYDAAVVCLCAFASCAPFAVSPIAGANPRPDAAGMVESIKLMILPGDVSFTATLATPAMDITMRRPRGGAA